MAIIVVLGLIFLFTYNYAQAAAGGMESALAKEGAAKVCDRGDNGHGPDNSSPWYYAIYRVPGDHEHATNLIRKAAANAGFSLKEEFPPINREDNKFYADRSSKKSNYLWLKPGNIELSAEVYGSSIPASNNGGDFCTLDKSSNPPTDKTTVSISIGLPSF
jgi:hypothetical protein